MKIYKMYLVGEESSFQFCVEIQKEFEENIFKAKEEHWNAVSYRMSTCNKFVQEYIPIGSGYKISDDQLAVKLTESNKETFVSQLELLTSNDSTRKHALIFLPKENTLFNKDFSNEKKSTFDKEIVPLLKEDGLVAYPIEYGEAPLVTSCTCKSFFGCTSGCCTNPTCNVILGICQSNSDCKKTDVTSSCNCQ